MESNQRSRGRRWKVADWRIRQARSASATGRPQAGGPAEDDQTPALLPRRERRRRWPGRRPASAVAGDYREKEWLRRRWRALQNGKSNRKKERTGARWGTLSWMIPG